MPYSERRKEESGAGRKKAPSFREYEGEMEHGGDVRVGRETGGG